MTAQTLKSRIVALVDIALQRQTSDENRAMIVSKIAKMSFEPDAIRKTIRRIRMVISLLISEELADDVYEELAALHVSDSDDGGPPYRL